MADQETDGFGFNQDARNWAEALESRDPIGDAPSLFPPFPYPCGPRFDPEEFGIPVVVPEREN